MCPQSLHIDQCIFKILWSYKRATSVQHFVAILIYLLHIWIDYKIWKRVFLLMKRANYTIWYLNYSVKTFILNKSRVWPEIIKIVKLGFRLKNSDCLNYSALMIIYWGECQITRLCNHLVSTVFFKNLLVGHSCLTHVASNVSHFFYPLRWIINGVTWIFPSFYLV